MLRLTRQQIFAACRPKAEASRTRRPGQPAVPSVADRAAVGGCQGYVPGYRVSCGSVACGRIGWSVTRPVTQVRDGGTEVTLPVLETWFSRPVASVPQCGTASLPAEVAGITL
jgi:hypothetical protein